MANSLPSPPSSPKSTPAAPDTNGGPQADLEVYLDSLLEKYLGLLDLYSALSSSLSKQFSNGFFTLASAQRNANMGSGRRYGRDGFDNRMKAIRTIRLDLEHDLDSGDGAAHETIEKAYKFSCQKQEHVKNLEADVHQSASEKSNDHRNSSQISTTDNKGSPAYRDPATWFGILVPSALRQTQQHFITAVEETIPLILSLRASMQILESKIWKTRDTLGLSHTYPEMPTDEEVVGEAGLMKDIDRLLAKAKI